MAHVGGRTWYSTVTKATMLTCAQCNILSRVTPEKPVHHYGKHPVCHACHTENEGLRKVHPELAYG